VERRGEKKRHAKFWSEDSKGRLFIDFKKAYDSGRREVLYNVLIEFGIPKKLVRLIKKCLNETYSRVRVGKHLFDMFPIKNSLKQGDVLLQFLCFRVCHYGGSGKRG
jgi:hypothetical protein